MKSDVIVNAEQALAAVPTPNQAVTSSRSAATKQLIVTIPLRKPRVLVPPLSWILPFRKERRVSLDKLGEEVYTACDGRRSAAEIIEQFANRHDLKFHEARIPVMQYLRDLMQRGIIVLVGRETPQGAGSHR